MKKNVFFLLFLCFSLPLLSQSKEGGTYYYTSEKNFLEYDTQHFYVSSTEQDSKANISPLFEMLKVSISKNHVSLLGDHSYYWSECEIKTDLSVDQYLSYIEKLRKNSPKLTVAPYFKNEYGDILGLSNFFYVKLKSEGDIQLLKQMALNTKTEIVKQNQHLPQWCILSVDSKSDMNALEAANYFYESGHFEYAYPDFTRDIQLPKEEQTIQVAKSNQSVDNTSTLLARSTSTSESDPYIDNQWGLAAVGAQDMWECGVTGKGIVVAVFDGGIDLKHPDLIPNLYYKHYNVNADSVYYSDAETYMYNSHGTFVAGIIGAAANNGIGIAGVAPECQLMSLSFQMTESFLIEDHFVDAVIWALHNGADIINISWGPTSNFLIIEDAISYFTQNARNGKGGIFISASGNSDRSYLDPIAAYTGILTVGAINSSKNRVRTVGPVTWGSNYGTGLDVMAPGENIISTNVNGTYIYDSGTSFAAPHVAGIAALYLSSDPTITYSEVRNRIEQNCEKVTYSYPNPTPPHIPPHINVQYNVQKQNGLWNNEMGYGVANCNGIYCETRVGITNDMECACPDDIISISLGHYYSRNYDYVAFQPDHQFLELYYTNSTAYNPYADYKVKQGYNGYVSVGVEFLGSYENHPFRSNNFWIGTPPKPILKEGKYNETQSSYKLILPDYYLEDLTPTIQWQFPAGWTVYFRQENGGGYDYTECSVYKNANQNQVPFVSIENECGKAYADYPEQVNPSQFFVSKNIADESYANVETIDSQIISVTIYNIYGNKIYQQVVKDKMFDLYTLPIADGIYILDKAMSDGSSSQEKVLIAR